MIAVVRDNIMVSQINVFIEDLSANFAMEAFMRGLVVIPIFFSLKEFATMITLVRAVEKRHDEPKSILQHGS